MNCPLCKKAMIKQDSKDLWLCTDQECPVGVIHSTTRHKLTEEKVSIADA